jgi:phage terminase large subunit-like protein
MAKKNKSYLEHTGTEVYAHHITHDSSGSEFKALSSDSKSLDGLQPILGIVDELHAHRDRTVYDVIDSAMSKRKDSMLMVITTAGFSLEGIGYSQSCYAKKVALGEIPDEAFMPVIYTLDEDDDWKDERNWPKANPNWGVSVDTDTFKSKAFKAKANPSDETNFKVKHLNLWQNAASQFFNLREWDKLAQDLTIEDFIGEPCFVGIDLASKKDLTSFVYVFKRDGKFYIFAENFVPEFAVEESKNVNYKKWVEDGYLIQTPGKAINYEFIESRFFENSKKFKIKEAFFDPWNAAEFAQIMSKKRIEMCEFGMKTANLSEPMKRLDSSIIEGNVAHDGSPLMSWCLSNVVAKIDHNDNVFPRKEHENMKIDPIISTIMGIAGWINEEANGSIYEERGMIFI